MPLSHVSPPPHPFPSKILKAIQDNGLVHAGDRVLVAVSGGPDSMALLECLSRLANTLSVAQITILHFNHCLRGKESDEDRDFVAAEAARRALHLVEGAEDVKTSALKNHVSLEMAARDCRHRFFSQAMKTLGAHRLALGHNADDQMEEILLRLCRGTGPSGMAGMPARTNRGIIRPLLNTGRDEILRFLKDENIPYRSDPSNESLFCRRNVLRHQVIPLLKKHLNAGLSKTLGRHTHMARDEESYWEKMLREWCEKSWDTHLPSGVSLKREDILAQPKAFRRRLYRFLTAEVCGATAGLFMVHVEALDQWIHKAQSGKALTVPPGISVSREGDRLFFSRERLFPAVPAEAAEAPLLLMDRPGLYECRELGCAFHLRCLGAKDIPLDFSANASHTACLDADRVCWPLSVQRWRKGDRFSPLGLRGSKKVQDFFVDEKVPGRLRSRVPILWDRDKICWIVGHRLDDRVKLTPATTSILLIEVSSLSDNTPEYPTR